MSRTKWPLGHRFYGKFAQPRTFKPNPYAIYLLENVSGAESNRPAAEGSWLLTLSIDDSPLGQIVGRQFDLNPITRNNSDEVFTHFASNMCEH